MEGHPKLEERRALYIAETAFLMLVFASIVLLPFWSISKLFGSQKISLIDILWVVWIPFFVILLSRKGIVRKGLKSNYRVLILFFSFLGWLLLTLIWAEDRGHHWKECRRLLSFTGALVPLYILLATADEKRFSRLLKTIQIALMLAFVMAATIQLLHYFLKSERLADIIDHKNVMASMVAVGVAWTLPMITFGVKNIPIFLPVITFLFCFLSLPLTDARASMLTAFALVLVMAVATLRIATRKMMLFAPAIVAFLLLFSIQYHRYDFWSRRPIRISKTEEREKMSPIFSFIHRDPNIKSRLTFWEYLKERLTVDRMLVGSGYRKTPLSEEYQRGDVELNLVHEHNETFRIFLSTGLIGTLFFLLILAHTAYVSVRLYTSDNYRHISVSTLLVLITYSTLGIVDCITFHKRSLFLLMFLFSVFFGVYARCRLNAEGQRRAIRDSAGAQ